VRSWVSDGLYGHAPKSEPIVAAARRNPIFCVKVKLIPHPLKAGWLYYRRSRVQCTVAMTSTITAKA
jgi:hypothetical protein